MLIALWLFGAFFVGFVFGVARKIGFWGSFLISLILSPALGLIITLFSEDKKKAAERKRMIELQEENNRLLKERTRI
jgi:hypothetical protein